MLETHEEVDDGDATAFEVDEGRIDDVEGAGLERDADPQGPEQLGDQSGATRGVEYDEEIIGASLAEAEKQMPLPRRTRSSPKTSKKHKPTISSLDHVLSMPNRELGRVICAILEECPNYTSKKEDLTKRVSKYFDFITRGVPRKKLKKKIVWAVTHLKKAGQVEEYKAKNIRVRLLNPTGQGRLI